jgi:hypothetical protein
MIFTMKKFLTRDMYFVFRRNRTKLRSCKKSGGGVLIAVKQILDVEELQTASGITLNMCALNFNAREEAFLSQQCIWHLMLEKPLMSFLFET